MGCKIIAAEKKHNKQLTKMTMKPLRNTKTIDGKLKRSEPLFYESVFRVKNRAGNVGSSHLQVEKLYFERD